MNSASLKWYPLDFSVDKYDVISKQWQMLLPFNLDSFYFSFLSDCKARTSQCYAEQTWWVGILILFLILEEMRSAFYLKIKGFFHQIKLNVVFRELSFSTIWALSIKDLMLPATIFPHFPLLTSKCFKPLKKLFIFCLLSLHCGEQAFSMVSKGLFFIVASILVASLAPKHGALGPQATIVTTTGFWLWGMWTLSGPGSNLYFLITVPYPLYLKFLL